MKYYLIIILLFISVHGISQNAEQDDLKVGLVLSGGGAKGLAHIGVLKVIDSLGIRVDYVAGTSMGAIIGSLYAAGYSGKELDSIFRVLDFSILINDELPRASKAFYERNNSERYAVTLPFDHFKIKLPSALSRGQNVYGLISKLTIHVNEAEDFSKLPIPFFCIATDAETGREVILDKGILAQAVMASGALPSLFQPVMINDQMLIDGGVVNNYPIDELKKKGVDVIIGVDVQGSLATREELTSAPDILVQINNFRTVHDMTAKVEKTDIYIKPDIKDFSVISFDDGSTIIKNGVDAAISQSEAIKKVVRQQKQKPKLEIKKTIQDTIRLNTIITKGNERYSRAYVLGKLRLKGNEIVSYKNFNKGVNNLIATNNFDYFQYEFKKTLGKEGYDLVTELTETKINTYLKLGVHYDKLYKSAALINLTKKKFLFKNDVVSLDLIFGDNVRYNFDYFIDKGFYWSIGVKSRYNEFNKSVNAQLLLSDQELTVTGINKADVELQDQTNQFYLQTLFRRDFASSIGLEHKRLRITSETFSLNPSNEPFVFEQTDYLSVFGNIKLDTYDNKYFPKRGVYFNGYIHNYFYASQFNNDFENFSIAKADIGYAFSVSDKLSLNLQTSGGFKLGDNSTNTLDFALGGYGNNLINNFIPFLGYDFISLIGNSYVKAYASADFEIFKHQHITLEGNWANIENDIFRTGEWFTLPDYRGYALGYAIETFLGPIQAKYSYSPEQSDGVWFVNVGFWF
ncbi:patatin-like phospholipase family protein [Gaetbulibacter aquiaggeris]|uniref:Patatin-like phospholipase family protein n=1 Tax=Gaetbulibacter aquiaggeris TaxID=1735373 RepID=A0ABW7MLQ4_9FLAO